jgi:hypothetical protein
VLGKQFRRGADTIMPFSKIWLCCVTQLILNHIIHARVVSAEVISDLPDLDPPNVEMIRFRPAATKQFPPLQSAF